MVSKIIGAKSKEVLYLGDHIYGDVVVAKKMGWRTFLIVPELTSELRVWTDDNHYYRQVHELEKAVNKVYK